MPSTIHREVAERGLVKAVLSALLLALATAVAAQETTESARSTSTGVEAEASAQSETEETAASDEEEYKWFYPQDRPGYRYRVERVPKVENAYRWLDENWVRFPRGVTLEVVSHDDQWFYVKQYAKIETPEGENAESPPPPPPPPEPMPEVMPESVDRLEFRPFEEGLPRRGQWRNGFDLGDMNGDGHLDIVFGPARKSNPRPNIFLGDGAGRWTPWQTHWPEGEPYDYGDAAVGDFNGDGHLDVAFGIHLRGLLAFLGDGKGGFTRWSEGIQVDFPGRGGAGTSFSSRAIEVLDWNGDGRPDILALGEGPKGMGARGNKKELGRVVDTSRGFLVYLNQGDGTWQMHRPTVVDESLDFGDDFAVADFDGDGHRDLVSGSMRMGNPFLLYVGEEPMARRALDLPDGTLVRSLDADDLDGDGRPDLILGFIHPDVSDWRTSLSVLFADGELGWKKREVVGVESRKNITALDTGDLDGDGNVDIVALTGEGEVWVFLGDGEGGFRHEISPALPSEAIKGCSGAGLHVRDLDGDGRAEIVASFAGEPTGFVGIEGLSFPGCPGQGSLRAWKSVARDESAEAEGAPGR